MPNEPSDGKTGDPIIAQRLRAARTRAGLTQKELAARISTTPAAISMFESGRAAPAAGTLRRLADELDLTFLEPRHGTAAGTPVTQEWLADVLNRAVVLLKTLIAEPNHAGRKSSRD